MYISDNFSNKEFFSFMRGHPSKMKGYLHISFFGVSYTETLTKTDVIEDKSK